MSRHVVDPVGTLQRLRAHMLARAQWQTVWTARDAKGVLLGWEVARYGTALARRHATATIARERFPEDKREHVVRWPVIREVSG